MGKMVNSSANIRSKTGYSVLVTGAAGFVRTHISAILKRHDHCVLGLDNFNNNYDPTLKGLVKFCWKKVGFLLYAKQSPYSYIHSNIVGFVNVLEVCKNANSQPAIVWASSSSVYG
ncbi:putative UDP-glucuronate 4-epimerase [Helianthus annuus]|uniref:UDP-glucuronate 4-epimerase n=1 Tax=Helianthus annuus TaxID=4232 RepID=A0A9K3HE68_HELAN|nr:putative UDP-glucuronate 4-epimerase [Helianthus annuus]